MPKWIMIQPLKTKWKAPDINQMWSSNSFANMSRLLQADAYHIDDIDIPLDADIYFISSFDINLIEKEIDFAKKIKSLGKKVVSAFSQDLRFLFGAALINERGSLYSELVEVSDVVLSGINSDLKVFGRFQDKVIPFGLPFEKLKFNNTLYENRTIDILVSGDNGAHSFAFDIEILLLLKKHYPDKRIVYSIDPKFSHLYNKYAAHIEFVPGGLLKYLPNSKLYFSPELRPRPGRSLIESFYCRTPFIACEWSYHTNLFPDLSFNSMDMYHILDTYTKFLDMDYNTLITKAERIAENDYFDIFYKRLMDKLYD